jgi:hypothetical protein
LPWILAGFFVSVSFVPAPPQCSGCVRLFDTDFSVDSDTNECALNLQVIEDTNGCPPFGSSVDGTCVTMTGPVCQGGQTCKSRVLLQYSTCCDGTDIDWTCGAPPGTHLCTVSATTMNCGGPPVWEDYPFCGTTMPPPCFAGEASCNMETGGLECSATLEATKPGMPPVDEAVSIVFVTKCTECML